MTSSNSTSDSWTSAIYSATSCLRTRNTHDVDHCIDFLTQLENQLRYQHQDPQGDSWSQPPTHPAPDWIEYLNRVNSVNHASHTSTRQSHTEFIIRAPNTGYHLDCRRILIRILTCQSECYALKASSSRGPQEWKLGAETLTISLEKIYLALDVADTQISKWIALDSLDVTSSKRDLVEDANIVGVAIESLIRGKDDFIRRGEKEEAWLLRKLEPQWEARDQVKRRIGEERWKNNPNPKMNYAKLRQELEARQRDVHDALQVLATMEYNLDQAHLKSMELKVQLETGVASTSISTNPAQARYNGLRPDERLLEQRVSLQDYPDPCDFGWTFTGSSNVTEFFEKDQVKLDWYFTTATMKTSLHHPQKGKTQMFRKQVSPALYRKILEDPRTHTNKGYQKRNNKRRPNRQSS